jgi:hypothetical protein
LIDADIRVFIFSRKFINILTIQMKYNKNNINILNKLDLIFQQYFLF